MSDDLGTFFDPEELARAEQQRQQHAADKDSETSGNGQGTWPLPEPLIAQKEDADPYPLEALPPIIRDAVSEYQPYGQQPLPLIAAAALSCVSLATQGLADVARDDYLIGPISLYCLTIAVSGERKTSADNWFKAPLVRWMVVTRDAQQAEVDEANAVIAAWEAKRAGLLAKIKAATGKPVGKDSPSVKQLQDELVELAQDKPDPVLIPRLFYEDTNSPTLACDLASDWPSASLWSDEAGLVVGAHGMSDDMAMGFFGLLNRLWDGKPFDRDRNTVRRAYVRGRRFTVCLMMQPVVMARLLSIAGGASRAMGLLSRFFLAWPSSTIGTRKYKDVAELPAISRLGRRIEELLNLPLPVDPEAPAIMALRPPVLQLTQRAHRAWACFHDDIEAELGKDGRYADVADIGAKVAENAVRLAAQFHILNHGVQGEIDSKTLYWAVLIAQWHLHDARRALGAFDRPQGIVDAEILLEWLLRQPAGPIEPRKILQLGPRALGKDVKRRDAALAVLVDYQFLIPLSNGRKRQYLLNPRAKEAL